MGAAGVGVAYSPDGRQLLLAARKNALLVNIPQRTPTSIELPVSPKSAIAYVAFSPDGKYLATAGKQDFTARLWDVNGRSEVRAAEGHSAEVASVGFSPDGRKIVTASKDLTARIWDAASGAELRRLEGLCQGAAGRRILAGWQTCRDIVARLFGDRLGRGNRSPDFRPEPAGNVCAARLIFTEPVGHVVTASVDRLTRIWDAETGTAVRPLHGGQFAFYFAGRQADRDSRGRRRRGLARRGQPR